MKLIKLSPGRNYAGRRRHLTEMTAEVMKAEREGITEWYCNDCGFVPVGEIKDRQDGKGTCKCGRPTWEIPF